MDFERLRRSLTRLAGGPAEDPPVRRDVSDGLSIFINYRRDDSGAVAALLHRALSDHFGEQQLVVIDFALDPGSDWAESMRRAVDSFTVVLALIGPSWNSASDSEGRRRLEDPGDFVRIELETALEQNARVIPVLVDNATMPTHADLPPTLRSLADRNAFVLSSERMREDVAALTAMLDRFDEAAVDLPWGAIEPLRGGSP